MTQSTTNQIRQILMNELGITRESIREEVRNIVAETVLRYIQSIPLDEHINKAISKSIQGGPYDFSSLKEKVGKEMEKQIAAHLKKVVEKSIKITIEAKP